MSSESKLAKDGIENGNIAEAEAKADHCEMVAEHVGDRFECKPDSPFQPNLEWIEDQPDDDMKDSFRMRFGEDINLSVGDSIRGGERWKWICVSLGEFTKATTQECKETWLRESIAAVRNRLDEFEKAINERNAK